MKNTKPRKEAGFSLVEVMVAVVILTVLVLGAGAMLNQSSSTVAIHKMRRVAIEAASARLEQLKPVPYSDIRPGSTSILYLDQNNNLTASRPNETVSINGVNEAIVTTVQRVDRNTPDGEYIRINVQVQYQSGDNWVSLVTNKR